MRKIFIVAGSEFLTAIRTKAFLLGMILMPVLMGGGILLQRATRNQVDTETRRFAVIDHTGRLYSGLARAAEEWNAGMAGSATGKASGPRFVPSPMDPRSAPVEHLRVELSRQVRDKALFAFVEIQAGVIEAEGPGASIIRYHSNQPTQETLRRWIETTLNREILTHRFRAAAIDQGLVARLSRRVAAEHLGLFERDDAGRVQPAQEVDRLSTFAIPGALMFLLFMVVMTTAPQLMNSVLEEKMGRISEVLLGSVSPFELMMGKLCGGAGVSMALALVYLAGGFAVARYWGYADAVTPGLILWFLLFLMFALFINGSIFVATGAACADLKDTQSLMWPAMILVMLPMFTWTAVLRAPDSTFSVAVSLFPPATPFLMLLRIALPPGPPLWQVLLAVVLTAASTVAIVWATGKIFRTGVLMQGKAPSFVEMLRWVRAK